VPINYPADSPDVLAQDMAAIREGLAQAMGTVGLVQSEARTFFESYGPAVSAGHSDVGSPGDLGSDPDSYGADASDG
jgi:hypothetical protein